MPIVSAHVRSVHAWLDERDRERERERERDGAMVDVCMDDGTGSGGEEGVHDSDAVVSSRIVHRCVTLVIDVVDVRLSSVNMRLDDVQQTVASRLQCNTHTAYTSSRPYSTRQRIGGLLICLSRP